MGGPAGTAVSRVKKCSKHKMPAGFLTIGRENFAADLQDAGQEIGWVPVLALPVYMVLASLFESLLHPLLTVMLTVPLAAVGALICCG